jgi:O-methyltransferase
VNKFGKDYWRSDNMRLALNKKEAFRRLFVSVPLPFSKWLYAFARNSVLRDAAQPYFDMAFQTIRSMQLRGDYLEFGVYAGTSFILAASSAAKHGLGTMRYFAFDSFEGLPEAEGGIFNRGDFCRSEQDFTRMITKAGVPLDKVVKVKGWYHQSLTKDIKEKYRLDRAAIVHIDCDLYSSTRDVLSFLQDIVQIGTILIFDDWHVFHNEKRSQDLGEEKAFREWPLRSAFEELYDVPPSKAFIMTR